MSNDISSVSAARPPVVSTPAPIAPQTARPDAAPVQQADIKLPVKADLKFDEQEMQHNLKQALDSLNEQMKQNGRNLSFRMDEAVNRPIVTVTNAQTGEVIRQIPNETVLRIAHNMEDLKGMFLNEKS